MIWAPNWWFAPTGMKEFHRFHSVNLPCVPPRMTISVRLRGTLLRPPATVWPASAALGASVGLAAAAGAAVGAAAAGAAVGAAAAGAEVGAAAGAVVGAAALGASVGFAGAAVGVAGAPHAARAA